MPKEGNLADSSFCEILAELSRCRETGVLRLSGTAPSKSVYLQEGKIVFASSTDPDDRLGELLLTRGVIDRQQLDEASRSLKQGKRLGTALVEQGFLPASDLPRWVREQVKEILFSLFSWTEGTFVFEAGPFPSDEAITLRLSTPEVFLSGLKLVQKWSVLRKGAGEIRIPYKLAADPRSLLKDVPLGEEEERLLQLLESKPVTMEQAALESGLTTLKVYQLFFAFRVLEVIAPVKVVAPVSVTARPPVAAEARPAEAPVSPHASAMHLDPVPAAAPKVATEASSQVGSQTVILDLGELQELGAVPEMVKTSPPAHPVSPAAAHPVSEESAAVKAPASAAWKEATDDIDPAIPIQVAQAEVAPAAQAAPPAQAAPAPRPPAASPARRVAAAAPQSQPAPAAAKPAAPRPAKPQVSAPPGPPALPTAADAPAQIDPAAASRRNKPDLRVVRLDERRLEGEGPQHLEDLIRQWFLKGYRLAGVVPARAPGLFGSSGSTYLIFTRDTL